MCVVGVHMCVIVYIFDVCAYICTLKVCICIWGGAYMCVVNLYVMCTYVCGMHLQVLCVHVHYVCYRYV